MLRSGDELRLVAPGNALPHHTDHDLPAMGRAAVAWALVPIVFTALIYLPLNSFENRYSQPTFPFITLLGAVALVAVREKWSARRSPKVVTA